jgi:hypothetical protein
MYLQSVNIRGKLEMQHHHQPDGNSGKVQCDDGYRVLCGPEESRRAAPVGRRSRRVGWRGTRKRGVGGTWIGFPRFPPAKSATPRVSPIPSHPPFNASLRSTTTCTLLVLVLWDSPSPPPRIRRRAPIPTTLLVLHPAKALFGLLGLNPDMDSIQVWIGLIQALHPNPNNPR